MMNVKRLLAGYIDYAIAFALLLVFFVCFTDCRPTFGLLLLSELVLYVLFIFRDLMFGNASIGKKICRLQVVSVIDEEKAKMSQLILRNITCFILPVEVLLILTNNQRLGDMLAKTKVVAY